MPCMLISNKVSNDNTIQSFKDETVPLEISNADLIQSIKDKGTSYTKDDALTVFDIMKENGYFPVILTHKQTGKNQYAYACSLKLDLQQARSYEKNLNLPTRKRRNEPNECLFVHKDVFKYNIFLFLQSRNHFDLPLVPNDNVESSAAS